MHYIHGTSTSVKLTTKNNYIQIKTLPNVQEGYLSWSQILNDEKILYHYG